MIENIFRVLDLQFKDGGQWRWRIDKNEDDYTEKYQV